MYYCYWPLFILLVSCLVPICRIFKHHSRMWLSINSFIRKMLNLIFWSKSFSYRNIHFICSNSYIFFYRAYILMHIRMVFFACVYCLKCGKIPMKIGSKYLQFCSNLAMIIAQKPRAIVLALASLWWSISGCIIYLLWSKKH